MSGSDRNRALVVGALVFLVSFGLHFIFILKHFYVNGAYLLDSGVFASMMWRATPFCLTPHQDAYVLDGTSYYSTHLTLLAGLFSATSYLVPTNHIIWFALYQGLSFGILAYSIFYIGQTFYWRTGTKFLALWFCLATGFANSGFSIAIATYPHHETASSGLQILFFAFLLQRRIRLASLWFCLALLVREDVGFHLCAILGLLTVYKILRRESFEEYRYEALFMVLAFLGSFAAIMTQKLGYPGGDVFYHTYLGDPATRGWGRIWGNFQRLLELRQYLWLPVATTFLFAVGRRDFVLFLALAAYLPWTLLNLHGTRPEPGTLFAYYAYPLFNSFAWILLSKQLTPQQRASRHDETAAIVGFIAIILTSTWGLGIRDVRTFIQNSIPSPAIFSAMRIHPFFESLQTAKLEANELRVDSAIVCAADRSIPPLTWLCGNKSVLDLKVMLFWHDYIDLGFVNKQLILMQQPRVHLVDKTKVAIATKSNFVLSQSTQQMLVPMTRLWASHRLWGGRELTNGRFEIATGTAPQLFLRLYLLEPPGATLRVRYSIDCSTLNDKDSSLLITSTAASGTPPQETKVTLTPGKSVTEIVLEFPDEAAKSLEISLTAPAETKLLVEECEFIKE